MREKIQQIVAATLKLDENTTISDQDDLKEYGLSSISMVTLILALEKNFGIGINDDDLKLEYYESIENIIKVVEKYL